MTVREWYIENYFQLEDKSKAKKLCAEACNVKEDTARKRIYVLNKEQIPIYNRKIETEPLFSSSQNVVEKGIVLGLTENELRMKHDLFYIVKENAEKLKVGIYLSEAEFVKISNLKGSGYRAALDHPSFNEYKGKAGGITYWSHKESIDKMKKEGVLC